MMSIRRYFHGTSEPERILSEGFRLDGVRRRDAGDFGEGIYLTPNQKLAKLHGTVLKVYVDTAKFAYLPFPYFLDGGLIVRPKTESEWLFYWLAFENFGRTMLTVQSDRREATARKVRLEFLAHGYHGIRTGYRGETVVFDLKAIKAVKRLNKKTEEII